MSKVWWGVAAVGLAVGALAWFGPGLLPTGPATSPAAPAGSGGPAPVGPSQPAPESPGEATRTPESGAASPTSRADDEPVVTVHLTTGRAITGKLAATDEAQVVLRVPQGKLTFPRKLVDRIEAQAPGRFALSEALEHALAGRHDAAEAAFQEALADPGSAAQARAAYARYQAKLEHTLADALDAPAASASTPEPPAASPRVAPPDRPAGWPPGQVAWERGDPADGFARARREGKPVLLYLGNTGCPHCKTMEREVWGRPQVAAAAREVVPLALYADASRPSDWQVRLGLLSYPRVVWLDGWGRRLDLRAEPRREGGMLQAIDRATQLAAGVRPASRVEPPTGLASLLQGEQRRDAGSELGMTRSRAWRAALPRVPTARLPALYAWAQEDDDPVLRRAILVGLEPGAAARDLLRTGLGDAHVWVHRAALKAAARLGERALIAPAQAQAEAILDGRGLDPHHAQVRLCDLIRFLGELPDAGSLPLLRRVLETYGWRYTAVPYAIRAAGRIHASDPARLRGQALATLRPALARDEVWTGSYAPWQARIYGELIDHAWQVLGRPAPPAGDLRARLEQTRAALR